MSQFKNHREVLEALLAGKKIRSNSWILGSYIYIDNEGILRDEKQKMWSAIPRFDLAEIYTPPKTLGEKILEIMSDHTRSAEKALSDIRYVIESGNYKE